MIQTREEFYKAVRDLTEERVVEFVKSHHLAFLGPEEAVKIRKEEKRRPLQEDQADRSNQLKESLVILSDGTIFRTGRSGLAGSVPGGAASVLLGVGSHKSVYQVEDLSTHIYVAVAEMRLPFRQKDLKREQEITQNIDSPHVHKIRGFSQRPTRMKKVLVHGQSIDGVAMKSYAVSDICQNSLDQMLKKDPRYLQKHPEHLRQIESALNACEAAGILHNDLRIQNIFIQDGIAMLADFGEAERIEELSPARRNDLEAKQSAILNDLRRRYAAQAKLLATPIHLIDSEPEGKGGSFCLKVAGLVSAVAVIALSLYC